MNVLDLRGPAFLQLYVPLAAGAFAIAAAMRWAVRGPGGDPPPVAQQPTDPYDIAFLQGGPRAAVHAAAISLAHRELITFKNARFVPGDSLGTLSLSKLHPFERAVFNVVSEHKSLTPSKLVSLAGPYAAASRALESTELIVPGERQRIVRLIPALGPIAVFLLGLAKIGVGLSRGRPVAILVILNIVLGFLTLLLIGRAAHRTRRGDRVLADMRRRSAALRTTAAAKPQSLEPFDVAMACALFGPVVFNDAATGLHRDIARSIYPPSSSGSGCGSVSGCGGGGCGGGGCGGGCGGCGS